MRVFLQEDSLPLHSVRPVREDHCKYVSRDGLGVDPSLTVASGAWQKYSITLCRQWTACVRPLERFGHRAIKIVDEG